MSDKSRERVQVRAVSMYPMHWAIVDSFARDQGYGSLSAALRRIIDEWNREKSVQSRLAEGNSASGTILTSL
jgi:hypothetical protein